jgi:hypothetical protein
MPHEPAVPFASEGTAWYMPQGVFITIETSVKKLAQASARRMW